MKFSKRFRFYKRIKLNKKHIIDEEDIDEKVEDPVVLKWKAQENKLLNFGYHHLKFSYLVDLTYTLGYENDRYKNNRFLIKHLRYLDRLKYLTIERDLSSGLVENSFLAKLYFSLLERSSINVTIEDAIVHVFHQTYRYSDSLELSGYFLSLIASRVSSNFVTKTDKYTNRMFMKMFYTIIDLRSRKKVLQTPLISVGDCYDYPLEQFKNYNALSQYVKLGKLDPSKPCYETRLQADKNNNWL